MGLIYNNKKIRPDSLKAISVSALTATNISALFILQWLVTVTIGPGPETDAFFAGLLIPQLVTAIVITAVINVLLPLFSQADDAGRMLPAVIARFVLLSVPASMMLTVLAEPFVFTVFPGFDLATSNLAASLLRIQSWALPFMTLNGVLYSYNYSKGRNILVEFVTLSGTILCVLYIWQRLGQDGIVAAAVAMIIRFSVPSLVFFPYRMKWWGRVGGDGKFLRQFWSQVKPLMIGSSYYKIDILVDRLLTSMAAPGTMTLFNLAQQVHVSGNLVFNKAVFNPMMVKLAMCDKSGDMQSFWNEMKRKTVFATIFSACCLAICLFFGESILALLFEFKSFSYANVQILYTIVLLLGGVLMGGMLGQVWSAYFYAKRNTVLLTKIGVVGFTFGLFLKLIGFLFWGIYGLAIMTSVYYLMNFIIMVAVILYERLGCEKLKKEPTSA